MTKERDSEQQLILDAIAKGVCGLDREGTVLFCNQALLELGGWSPEEIVGQHLHDVMHPKREDGSVSPREECALHNGILRGELAQPVATLFRKKDSRWIPIEWYGCPLREPVGRTWYMVTISNFSDIETAREALRRKEEQYRRILESMPDVLRLALLSTQGLHRGLYSFAALWLRRAGRRQ